jgi:hypothetical protein
MKTAAGSGHKRGDLPPPGPVLHKLGPDFQLLAVEDHVGLITQGKPEVGVIKEVHFFEQSGGRTKIPTSETGTVHYYVHVLNGRNILANSKTVYKLPADKRGAEDLAGNLEAKRQKLHHFHHVIKPAAAVASSPPPDPALNKGVSFDLSQNEVKVADAVGEDAVGATGSIGGDKKDVSKKDVRDVQGPKTANPATIKTTPAGKTEGATQPSPKSKFDIIKELRRFGADTNEFPSLSEKQLRSMHGKFDKGSPVFYMDQLRYIGAPDEDLAAGMAGSTPEAKVEIFRSMLLHNRRKYTPDVQALNLLVEHPAEMIATCRAFGIKERQIDECLNSPEPHATMIRTIARLHGIVNKTHYLKDALSQALGRIRSTESLRKENQQSARERLTQEVTPQNGKRLAAAEEEGAQGLGKKKPRVEARDAAGDGGFQFGSAAVSGACSESYDRQHALCAGNDTLAKQQQALTEDQESVQKRIDRLQLLLPDSGKQHIRPSSATSDLSMSDRFSEAASGKLVSARSLQPNPAEHTFLYRQQALSRIAKLKEKAALALSQSELRQCNVFIAAIQQQVDVRVAELPPAAKSEFLMLVRKEDDSSTSHALKTAVENGDWKTIDKLMHGNKINVGSGSSDALEELRIAASKHTIQGKSKVLIKWDTVSPPGADYTGHRPWLSIALTKGHCKNVLFVAYFIIDPKKLESHRQMAYNVDVNSSISDGSASSQLASLFKELGTHSDLKKHKGVIDSVASWYEGATLLAEYASETCPPILTPASVTKHMKYILWFKKLLLVHHADQSKEVLTAGLRFDEDFRMYLARTCAPDDMDWDATAYCRYAEFKNKLESLQHRVVSGMQSQLTSLSSKFEAFLKSGSSNKNETKSTKSTKGGSEADKAAKKSKDHKSRLLRLSSPDGKKAQQKFLEQEGKLACAYFNMKNGCNSNKCKFSHHCPITGRMGKTAMEADE